MRPAIRKQPSPRKLNELKPGDRVILSVISNIQVDAEGQVWIDVSSGFRQIPLVPGLSLQAERTEAGFILWLDKQIKFRRGPRYKGREYLPVVELRDAPEEKGE